MQLKPGMRHALCHAPPLPGRSALLAVADEVAAAAPQLAAVRRQVCHADGHELNIVVSGRGVGMGWGAEGFGLGHACIPACSCVHACRGGGGSALGHVKFPACTILGHLHAEGSPSPGLCVRELPSQPANQPAASGSRCGSRRIPSALQVAAPRSLPPRRRRRRQVHVDRSGEARAAGVIDFGDMAHMPLVSDVAITLLYAILLEVDRRLAPPPPQEQQQQQQPPQQPPQHEAPEANAQHSGEPPCHRDALEIAAAPESPAAQQGGAAAERCSSSSASSSISDDLAWLEELLGVGSAVVVSRTVARIPPVWCRHATHAAHIPLPPTHAAYTGAHSYLPT